MTKDNLQLGKFILDGIQPIPRGQPEFEITYGLDTNTILNVIALEKSTDKYNTFVITNDKGRHSKDCIDRLFKETAKFKDEYKKVIVRIEAKNGCE